MCMYGTTVCYLLFRGQVMDNKLLEVTFFNPMTGDEFKADWFIISQYLFQRYLYVAGVFVLMAVMTCVLGAFLGYHVWITSRGMTTNEASKWGQVKKWHRQESKRYQQAVKEGLITVQNTASDPSSVVTDGDVTCTGAADVSTMTNDGSNEESDELPISDPGPMPTNIYNQGFVENWKEVIYPRSLRQDALDRWRRSLQTANMEPDEPLPPAKPKAN